MTATPASGGIGATLRAARERRGLSVRQIANTTRISTTFLEALERNDISRLPGGIFSRAFVRSYAVEVGLDPEQTIAEFLAQFPVEAVTAGHPTAQPVEDRDAFNSDQRMATTFGLLAVVSVPLVLLLLYVVSTRSSRDAATAPGTSAVLELTTSAEAATTGARDIELEARVSPQPGPLLVALLASARCWVAIDVDGRRVLERELQAGERELFDVADSLTINAGNAGALRVTLNGLEMRSLGASGEVVSFSISPANFRDFVINP